ncbi:MAG TPA: DUF4350 domain-containing protein [Albitalea sp.]|uniref:DUF4350 domain-containing protein n=1 Tax=Piscinibacter sp. TaxID=1903157 RepID=UPI002ED4A41A
MITREHLLNGIVALAVLACMAWVVQNTEWVDRTVDVPPRGEALTDPHYAVKQLLRHLAVPVVSPTGDGWLPPPTATLVLGRWHGDLFPQRDEALRRWVEGGGHLVLHDGPPRRWRAWAPIEAIHPKGSGAASPACVELTEPADLTPAYGERHGMRACIGDRAFLRSAAPTEWSLDAPAGPQALRIAVGRGKVTALRGWMHGRLLENDHALAWVAALHLQPGTEVWFVDIGQRMPLLRQVWHSGAAAVLLGAIGLALALWRGAVRFGPPAPAAPLARRSVAEQIRDTANFIFASGGAALHRAQLRALEQAARRHVVDHDRLDRRGRAAAIARLAALDAEALSSAMAPSLRRSRRELAATLTLLETAVRRLAPHR